MKKTRKSLAIALLVLLVSCASSQKKLQQAREKDPKYQYNIGLFYLNSNNVDEAIRYLNWSLSLDPRYYLAYNALGLAYSMKGNIEESIKHYQKCLEIAPSFSEARNNLGTAYQENGYLDKAEEEFKRVLADPEYAAKELPHYNLARLYFVRQNFDQALAGVEAAITLNGRLAMAHNLRGLILEAQGRVPEAIESYKQALKLVPDEVNFNFNLGAAYFKNNDWLRAAEVLEKITPRVTDPEMREKLNLYLKTIKEKRPPA